MEKGEEIEFPPNHVLMEEGGAPVCVYFLLEGLLVILALLNLFHFTKIAIFFYLLKDDRL